LLRDWESGVPLDEREVEMLERVGQGVFDHVRSGQAPDHIMEDEAVR